ncbi:hypothetical protein NDU88_006022 [Pleurodeles waltl]|uniref:Uncharacterized protein n=1 Tax=Pleurodeles waltl TaxID=8319 RepID=A0AAV7NPJ9_PLEWA|nr:hypothetical protein NDU88_006022 [Pleurodeles waltl]
MGDPIPGKYSFAPKSINQGHSERGGRSEQQTEYVKPRKDSQRSSDVSVKKEEKLPQQNPSSQRKKGTARAIRHATQEEGFTEEQEWALALDSAAEVTIVHQDLQDHLEVKATDDLLQVETADMHVSKPDRLYKVTIQLEGDIERTMDAISWDGIVTIYDILLAEKDWPPEFDCDLPYGEEIIEKSCSPLVPRKLI